MFIQCYLCYFVKDALQEMPLNCKKILREKEKRNSGETWKNS
jgi:hypothetical protein